MLPINQLNDFGLVSPAIAEKVARMSGRGGLPWGE